MITIHYSHFNHMRATARIFLIWHTTRKIQHMNRLFFKGLMVWKIFNKFPEFFLSFPAVFQKFFFLKMNKVLRLFKNKKFITLTAPSLSRANNDARQVPFINMWSLCARARAKEVVFIGRKTHERNMEILLCVCDQKIFYRQPRESHL